jgi:hypothetical protein
MAGASDFSITRADSMAVCAHHVAFRHFVEHPPRGHQHGSTGHDIEGLYRRISVIEVHLVRLELSAAIRARHATRISQ